MGLTKSSAGVPWNSPIDRFIKEETRIYTERLADGLASDKRRVAVIEESGLEKGTPQGVFKVGAVGMWGYYVEQLMVQYPSPQGRSIRRVGGVHKQAYLETKRMDFPAWEKYMIEAVVPMFKEGAHSSD